MFNQPKSLKEICIDFIENKGLFGKNKNRKMIPDDLDDKLLGDLKKSLLMISNFNFKKSKNQAGKKIFIELKNNLELSDENTTCHHYLDLIASYYSQINSTYFFAGTLVTALKDLTHKVLLHMDVDDLKKELPKLLIQHEPEYSEWYETNIGTTRSLIGGDINLYSGYRFITGIVKQFPTTKSAQLKEDARLKEKYLGITSGNNFFHSLKRCFGI
ncbi:hypothetical protein [Legionella fairfieldensis]|uniref:hypothetical protein n=1 Tax=Legionella fairfieldensis TaxID=45064 RepID=UPI00048ACAC9|nr:hypothetical protein [Legionella fairfieldensis]